MKVTVIGSGYVGLVTATCLAEIGNDVLCFDADQTKIATLGSGNITIHEPGLFEMMRRNVAASRLSFTNNVEYSVAFGQLQFIAVGTPRGKDGSPDLEYVTAAVRNIARYMTGHKVIVNKSTVPVGTADTVKRIVADELTKRGIDLPYSVVSNPEFLKEGAAVGDFMRPDRVVIGADDAKAIELMRELYAPFVRNHDRIITMDNRSAELTKYAANCMLATRICLMNELANLADKLDADIENVRIGIGSDSRIGYHFLYAGCGYGGSCLPKDVDALIYTAESAGQRSKVLMAVKEANDFQKRILLEKIEARFGKDLKGKHFALWGLAFKPNTDDMREAPSLVVIKGMWDMGVSVTAYDPVAMNESRRIFGDDPRLAYADSPMQALVGADALVIVTEWKELRAPDFDLIKATLKSPVIFDGRNMYNPAHVKAHGIEYYAMGRRSK